MKYVIFIVSALKTEICHYAFVYTAFKDLMKIMLLLVIYSSGKVWAHNWNIQPAQRGKISTVPWVKTQSMQKSKSTLKNCQNLGCNEVHQSESSGWNMIQLFNNSSGHPLVYSCKKPIQDLLCNDLVQRRATKTQRVRTWGMLTSPFSELYLKHCYCVALRWRMLNLLHSLCSG